LILVVVRPEHVIKISVLSNGFTIAFGSARFWVPQEMLFVAIGLPAYCTTGLRRLGMIAIYCCV
jgi:hypothetical protein